MIYSENTSIINTLKRNIEEASKNDPTGTKRISIQQRHTPFWYVDLPIMSEIIVIGLYDRYIITKPIYDREQSRLELAPMTKDGYDRMTTTLNQMGVTVVNPSSEFDTYLKEFFQRAHTVNRDIYILPRYQPEELVGCILFNKKPTTINETNKNNLFSNKLFFTDIGLKYDINSFLATMKKNEDLSSDYNQIKIGNRPVQFYYQRGLNHKYGDWVYNREETLWEQCIYSIAGFLNANLKDAQRKEFTEKEWANRIGNLTEVATYNTCYLTYLLREWEVI